MPLIHSKKKAAFDHNVEVEMKAGKPQKQSLAIAFNVKRKKKMATGGKVESAKSEARPMPDETADDKEMVNKNSGDKSPNQDKWTDQPTMKQAGKLSITPLSRPKMANGMYKVRDREDVLKEEYMQQEMPPSSDKDQPDEEYNEKDPKKSGTSPHPMKMMANGGMINDDVSMADAEEDETEHPAGLESDNDEMSPAKDEYMASKFAEGGSIDSDDSEDQPHDEEMEEHYNSIADAIMAKKKPIAGSDSGSMDEEDAEKDMMAEGGEVQDHEKIGGSDSLFNLNKQAKEQPNFYYKRNQEALKENLDEDITDVSQPMDSNEHSDTLSDEDAHDMVSKIRAKIRAKRGM